MIEAVRRALTAQHEATLWMLRDCISKCPVEHWEGTIGRWPFWNVVYHTLCFADLYLSPTEAAWKPRAVHPCGMKELEDEYPSRKFEKAEMLEYVDFCRGKAMEQVKAETEESLAGGSGFKWYKGDRLEMHFINIRHVQHHTGQLSAYLRRNGVDAKWCGSGWKS
jgi:uncharacterized damage-inducible protein DinB